MLEEKKICNKGPLKIHRNPFIEPSQAQHAQKEKGKFNDSLKGLSLAAIMNFEGNKRALIGDQLFKEGDVVVNQLKVLQIKEDKVVLGIQNEKYTLYIEKNPVSVRQNARRRLYN